MMEEFHDIYKHAYILVDAIGTQVSCFMWFPTNSPNWG